MVFLMNTDKPQDKVSAGLPLIHQVLVNIHGVLVAPDHYGIKSHFTATDPAYRPAGKDHPGNEGKDKLKSEQGEKQLVVMGVIGDHIIQNQQEKDHHNTE